MANVKPIAKVRQLVDAGAPVGDAIRITLGGSVPKWAGRKGLHRTPASMTITGRRVPPDSAVLAALVEDLGCTEEEVRELLGRATQQAVSEAGAA
jgi:hypothetical protein